MGQYCRLLPEGGLHFIPIKGGICFSQRVRSGCTATLNDDTERVGLRDFRHG